MTSPELLITITTSATAIVTIVNAIGANWGRKEVRQKAEEVKQVAQTVHEDIVSKVVETKDVIEKVVNGTNLSELSRRIDRLSDQVSHIETWMISERAVRIARTRISDSNKEQ